MATKKKCGCVHKETAKTVKLLLKDMKKHKGLTFVTKEPRPLGMFGERKKSVKYTRKDFVSTAAMIKTMPEKLKIEWALKKANEYAEDNPRFDRAKFLKACGV